MGNERPAGGIAAVVLAAGSSTRMGDINKLLAPIDGVPMIRRTVFAAVASRAAAVVVVVGHEAGLVRGALEGLDVALVENPDHASGMASSLRAGVAVASIHAGVLVALGDMPWVRVDTLDRLIAAAAPGRIVAPVLDGRRGNPVLWDRAFYPELGVVAGDAGGRAIIDAHPGALTAIPVDDSGVLRDVDTPDRLPVTA